MPTKVIVVDDDEKLRNLVKEYLEGYGYPVVALPDGSLLMETIRSEAPGVVILDLMLPDLPGTEVCRRLKADPRTRDVPVIMGTLVIAAVLMYRAACAVTAALIVSVRWAVTWAFPAPAMARTNAAAMRDTKTFLMKNLL